jgi:N-acetylmuramoyl-L-alanine amidase
VDAGHGGDEKGAWFPTHELVEKDINLDVARNLGKVLARDGAAVVLMREDDTFVQLSERVNKAKNVNARMFVSIHVNRYPEDRSCCGAQVFYRNGSSESQRLAELVQAQLRSIDVINTRHELPANYRVLRDSVVPAILVEIGFATNSRDRELLMSPHYRKDVIYAIRNGVIEFARENHVPSPNPAS